MKISLNYSWQFINNYKKEYLEKYPSDAEIIDIPHTTLKTNKNYFNEKDYQKVTTYRKTFDFNYNIKNKKVFINFDGFMSLAHIYLNKNKIGDFISGYLPVKVDITNFVKEKNNELIVVLDSSENKNIPPFGFAIDYLTFGGIYRKVNLEIVPEVYIDNVFIKANSKGEIQIQTNISSQCENSISYELYFENKLIRKFNDENIEIKNVKLWSIENPYLYKLKTILKTKFGIDEKENYFGFRDAQFKNDGFYLNNKKIKLIGLNRHQSFPYIGYAASKSLQELDAQTLKNKCGVNIVRTSHYPQSEDFLNECDKLGLLVFTETPGWQYVSKDNAQWRNNYFDFIKRMVIKERNHPSVICYGIRIDESQDDHELYLEGNKIAHQYDPTRQTTGVRNFKNSELLEDFYSFNDFSCSNTTHGLDNPNAILGKKNKPYLVTEYMGHMFPTKSFDNYDRRIEHALRHARVINDAFKYNRTCGCIGWCFSDYNTHNDFGSGDHICYHGVLDIYRNPKFASYIYSSQQDNFNVFEVLTNLQPGDRNEACFDKTYIATNADYVEMYSNENRIGKFYPDKKLFKNLKHPLIVIDNYIGDTFKEKDISKKDSIRISSVLAYVSIYGFNHLKINHLIILGCFMIKYKKKYSDLVDYWNKYVSAWGGTLKTYTFKAYKNKKLIGEKKIGQSISYDYLVSMSKDKLINDETYDTLAINLKYVDNNNNVCTYSNDPMKISVSGPIELLSPNLVSLEAGQLTIYVRSKNSNGIGSIEIQTQNKIIGIKIPVVANKKSSI